MKNFKVYFIAIFCFATVIVSCNEETSESPVSQEELGKGLFPERPDLEVGESNWLPDGLALGKILSDGLMTENLNALTPEDLAQFLIGEGTNAPVISNVSYQGSQISAGKFSGGTGILGFESGIVLSTGNIASIVGPNTLPNTTTFLGTSGDADLQAIVNQQTFDASVLEFDFTCENIQVISFQYVFSSEEYNQFVNSQFNDVFAFFLNGENIALIPDTSTPVSINNVNCNNPYNPPTGQNCEFFINNELGTRSVAINTEMDGLTVVFTATAEVAPGTNRIKLAIADVADRALDSNVFIKGQSFVCAPPASDVLRVAFDIHPGSCPNPIQLRRNGVIPAAILGNADFDVSEIDLSTVRLEGVEANNSSFEDIATPFDLDGIEDWNERSCHTLGSDGHDDLTLRFSTQAVINALGSVKSGDVLKLKIYGNLLDGTSFEGEDVVIIR